MAKPKIPTWDETEEISSAIPSWDETEDVAAPRSGMGDVKMAESQAGPIPGLSLGQRTGFGPVADFSAQAAKAGLKFAGNLAQAASTGPVNAIIQGNQDDVGFFGTLGNVGRALVDPFVPGESPIQQTGKSLERMGVDNQPRTYTERIPWFQAQQYARQPMGKGGTTIDGGLTADEVAMAQTLQPGEFLERQRTQPGRADELGFVIDLASPLYAVGAAKLLGAGAKYTMRGAQAGVKAAYPSIGRSAESLSGVPLETLEAYADPAQRAAMKANFGKEQEIGKALVEKINDKDLIFGKEIETINKSVDKLPKISTQRAVDAMENAKAKPDITSRPATDYDLTETEKAGNLKADKEIDFVRGSARPENLSESARKAAQAFDDARIDEAVKAADAAIQTKISDKAARIQLSTQSKAGKAGARAAKTKKEFLDLSDKAGKNITRWGKPRNESGAIAEDALDIARETAKVAKEAWIDAQGKYASGAISQADYSMAKATAEATERHSVATDAARRIYNGESIASVGSSLAEKYGMNGEALRPLLTEARDRARSVPKDATVLTAAEYLSKRRRLDANIDFSDKADDVVNRVQKAGRTEMMQTLERAAEDSGIPELKEAMKSYSSKARIIEDLEKFIGRDKGTQSARIEAFINNLFGRNSQHKQELTKKFGELVNDETLRRAKAAQQAQEIGWDGSAAWFPMPGTGAKGAGQQWLGRGPGAFLSSPVLASRMTLPLIRKLASARSPREAAFYRKALQNAGVTAAEIDAALISKEIAQQMPANALPFRKVAEEDDQQPQPMAQR
jgi:hypothetical protein